MLLQVRPSTGLHISQAPRKRKCYCKSRERNSELQGRPRARPRRPGRASVGPGAYCAAPGHREYSRSSRWPLRGRWGLQSELRRPAAPLALPGTPVGDPRQLHFNRKQQITQELGDGARPRALALWLSGRPAAPLAPPGTPVGDPRHLQPGPGGRAAYPAHRPDPRAHS